MPLKRRAKPVCHIFHYHRVNDEQDPYLGGLPVDAFSSQMRYLAANFPIVTLDQIATGDFPDQHSYCVAITFDDGYRDNFVCAFPILKRLQIPATIFLATGYVESGTLPWYDQVRLAFKLTTRPQFSMDFSGAPIGGTTQARLIGTRLAANRPTRRMDSIQWRRSRKRRRRSRCGAGLQSIPTLHRPTPVMQLLRAMLPQLDTIAAGRRITLLQSRLELTQ
jgi:hypothetical protein